MVFYVKFDTLCFIFWFMQTLVSYGTTTKDQTSPRVNTLSDDQDDIQKQLDNEARDRLQYATPKTIWVLHFPTHMQMPHVNNKRIPWNSVTSKHKDQLNYGHKSKWRQNGKVVPKDYKARNGQPQSPAAPPLKKQRSVTARIPLPFNRYQTKPKSMSFRVDRSGNKLKHDLKEINLVDGTSHKLSFVFLPAEQISRLRASQSPIAISLQKCPTWTSLDPLKFKGYWDNDGTGVLVNTGQTAYFTLDTDSRPRLSGGPLMGEYIFEQLHFHWSVDDFTGCEHVLDGHGYAAECHFVHYNSKYESMEAAVGHADGLAVVGFLLEAVDAPNPKFDKIVEGLEGIQKRDQTIRITAESLSWMERDDLREGSYVTYKGSLTTPPYTECVTWIIYEKPVQIGSEQLGLLRQLEGLDSKPIDRNVRPTQRHPPGHSVIYVKQVKAKL